MPSHNKIDFKTTRNEILNFERKLQLHYFFNKNKTKINKTNKSVQTPFETNPNFWPKPLNPSITYFCYKLHKQINKLYHHPFQPNLTPKHITAIKSLRNNKDIVIKKGDKGAGIVIMDSSDYVTKINLMLSDKEVYTKINNNITTKIKTEADKLILDLKFYNHINHKQSTNLLNLIPNCPKFYGVPKIHKPNCPLRPIVSQINGPTSNIHKLIDKYLTTAEKNIPFLLQDTTSFLTLLHNKQHLLTPNSILVTLDVTSLYTNIPHNEGIEYVSDFYQETIESYHNSSLKPIPKSNIIKLLTFALNNTVFEFNNNFYSQNYGCTMGAQSSVKYANIYMHKFLTKFRQQYKHYLPDFFARLVDDIFTIWNSDLDSLKLFITEINNFHPTIKFELNYSYTNITFLDTIVYIENNELKTKLYTKPTDKKQYLHYSSSHPKHIKNSIPYSQALRYRRIITEDNILQIELNQLKLKFTTRDYPTKSVDNNVDKVLSIPRNRTLQYKNQTQQQEDYNKFLKGDSFLPLILTYHPTLTYNFNNNLKRILQLEWSKLLVENPSLKDTFLNNTPQIVYKKHKTIASYLTSAVFPSPWLGTTEVPTTLQHTTATFVTKCLHPLCKCCLNISDLSHLTILKNHTLTTTNTLTCNTSNIIYLIHCNKCYVNYVGQTKRSLKDRFNNHRSDIKHNKQTAIGLHFNLPQHNLTNLEIMPLEQLTSNNNNDRLKLEKLWISQLHTIYPRGLNYYPIIYQS